MALPTRRQVVSVAAALLLVPLVVLIGVESYFFTHMPTSPMPAISQVVGVLVNHRVVYVTQGQSQFLSQILLACGLLIVASASTLVAAYHHYWANHS